MTVKAASSGASTWFLLSALVATLIYVVFLFCSLNPFSLIINPESIDNHVTEKNNRSTLVIVPDHNVNEKNKCDLFKGHWVPDLTAAPLYTNLSCPTLPDSKNCAKHGRKDVDYMNWRWKPQECELPRFDSKIFLSMLRSRRLAFIGDSIARNHIDSLLCLLSQDQTPMEFYRGFEDRDMVYYFPSYDFTLMVYWANTLIIANERVVNGSRTGVFDLHLDKVDDYWAIVLPALDYLIISDAHWFFRKSYLYEGGELIGCIYCDESNVTQLDVPFAVGKAFRSTLEFINDCEECDGLVTLLRTFSPSHFENGFWNTGGYCNRTGPYSEKQVNLNGYEWELRNSQVKEIERARNISAKRGNKNRYEIVDITRAMIMRPDGHPGSHWNNKNAHGYDDCAHWCLPGPIDVWNDLLMAVLQKMEGSTLD
ncbi:hypothetical protein MKW94_020355 [Papaver nudicaule]|uniref:Trichome birefringence-like N-terminal domain-containing protein n=1 Tax=Papaver nudicaule TaxID=74823 RepID=A0AA41VHU2_PAPNU|nr:hypothetical protein [Papaver nudicaule]